MPEPTPEATTTTPPATTPGVLSSKPTKADEAKPDAKAAAETKPDEKPWFENESHVFQLSDDLTRAGFELDADTLKAFVPLAKDLGIKDPAKAQALIDIAGNLVLKTVNAQAQAIDERAAKWADEVRADKEIGGDQLPATQKAAVDVVLKYGGKEFLRQLVDLRFENSPHLIRFLTRVAKATADDKFDASRGDGAANDTEADRAARLYGPEFNKSFGKD